MGNVLDDDQRYRAVHSRDPRFDGVFYTAVRTTGIYCRPSCPAQTPRRENTRFFPTAAAAQEAGFRACKRCRPDLAPGSPEWNSRADVVGRAMRLIQDGAIDRTGVDGLAHDLGYSTRQLRRLLVSEVGAGPVALARSERAQTARVLTQTTDMPLTDIAFAAGFGSVRQFNETMRAVHGRSPTQMRTQGRSRPGGGVPGAITLRLPYREPIDLDAMLRFLGDRAVPGVESHDGRTYRRVLRLPGGPGTVELSAGPGGPYVLCELRLTDPADITTAVRRCRRMLDLDADPAAVAEALGEDPLLGGPVRRHRGLRSPGHPDPAELAVRAVLGQQVSVKAARTLAGRLAARFGRPLPEVPADGDGSDGGTEGRASLNRVFPSPETLAAADPTDLGLPVSRGRALVGLAEAIATGRVDLGPGTDREATERALAELYGIGPGTAGYIRMRGLGDPDVFLSGDLGVRAGLEALGAPGAPEEAAALAHRWSPWRSYATHLLRASLDDGESTGTTDTRSRG
ncbi:AlkA N-terminal domain-containing protein [Nocardiopsis kunsanensis]|uniref:AlkA N-terminal domain-containing protein n=1 Tax=Nocardiopsis kunsanensis TaxID=141693 RepID=UPI0023573BED|nr:AlkA N-terminal domain-containing protein [Nocardiopsis kunsanensis]